MPNLVLHWNSDSYSQTLGDPLPFRLDDNQENNSSSDLTILNGQCVIQNTNQKYLGGFLEKEGKYTKILRNSGGA